MLKNFIYTFLVLVICISAASCFGSRRSDISKTAPNSDEKKPETKKDREKTKSESSLENEETTETKKQALNDLKEDESSGSPDTSTKDGFENRCGWYSNPTPGNHWLEDKDGEWIIGVQGGHQAEGNYPPEFATSQWIATNGYYGYGCACLSVKVDKKEGLVLEVAGGKARPLSACQNDPALREPSE